MIVKLHITFTRKEQQSLNVEIEDVPNLEWHQLLNYIDKNKVEILKLAGCTLSEDEIKHDFSSGEATIRII